MSKRSKRLSKRLEEKKQVVKGAYWVPIRWKLKYFWWKSKQWGAADNFFGRETISDNNDSPGYLDSDTNVDSDSSVENLPILDKELAENFLMIWQSRY